MTQMLVEPPQVHRWTREEYYKMAEAGLFNGRRVQLIEGQVIDMSPMGSPHATGVALVAHAMGTAFGAGYFVRVQSPIDSSNISQPEPDVAVILGGIRDFRNAHPGTAALIVEVADSSLNYDRNEKSSLYAKYGIADYWLVNIQDRQLEIHRHPRQNPRKVFGFDYRDVTIHAPGTTVTPLALQQAIIQVDDLLP